MSARTEIICKDLQTLSEDVQSLLGATAHMAEREVIEARERLQVALQQGKRALQQKAIESGKVVDQTIRRNPYQTGAVAFAVGLLLGMCICRRVKCGEM